MPDSLIAGVVLPVAEGSDESLVLACVAGNNSALDVLFQRYLKPLFYFLLKNSAIKDAAFLEDISQEVFLAVFQAIKNRQFTPSGAGSFRAWFYTTAQNICRTMNRRKGKEPKDLSPIALSLIPAKAISQESYQERVDRAKAKLDLIRSKLSPQEQKLLLLLCDPDKKKTYGQIRLEEPEFAKYSIDYLMRKMHIIRKKILKLKKRRNGL